MSVEVVGVSELGCGVRPTEPPTRLVLVQVGAPR